MTAVCGQRSAHLLGEPDAVVAGHPDVAEHDVRGFWQTSGRWPHLRCRLLGLVPPSRQPACQQRPNGSSSSTTSTYAITGVIIAFSGAMKKIYGVGVGILALTCGADRFGSSSAHGAGSCDARDAGARHPRAASFRKARQQIRACARCDGRPISAARCTTSTRTHTSGYRSAPRRCAARRSAPRRSSTSSRWTPKFGIHRSSRTGSAISGRRRSATSRCRFRVVTMSRRRDRFMASPTADRLSGEAGARQRARSHRAVDSRGGPVDRTLHLPRSGLLIAARDGVDLRRAAGTTALSVMSSRPASSNGTPAR